MDGAWGTFDKKTNESSGMIRSIVLGDMDMAWSAMRMTTERSFAVDYILPYYKYHYALVRILSFSKCYKICKILIFENISTDYKEPRRGEKLLVSLHETLVC